jgi:predicted RNA-binding protein with PUA-like domain
MAAFLFKTEPSEYSFADLQRAVKGRWDGVSNATAHIHLRAVKPGDLIYIYHTGQERAIVGTARALSDAYADPAHDTGARTAKGEIKFPVIDLKALAACKKPLTLTGMKADPRFADFALLRLSRLSVMPVPAALAAVIDGLTR